MPFYYYKYLMYIYQNQFWYLVHFLPGYIFGLKFCVK